MVRQTAGAVHEPLLLKSVPHGRTIAAMLA